MLSDITYSRKDEVPSFKKRWNKGSEPWQKYPWHCWMTTMHLRSVIRKNVTVINRVNDALSRVWYGPLLARNNEIGHPKWLFSIAIELCINFDIPSKERLVPHFKKCNNCTARPRNIRDFDDDSQWSYCTDSSVHIELNPNQFDKTNDGKRIAY